MAAKTRLRAATLLGISALAAVAATNAGAASDTAGRSTLERTISRAAAGGPFTTLKTGPGEPRLLRGDLARAVRGRSARRRSLLYFAHLTDFQLVDEESPGRVEALDPLTDPAPFAAAWRPQEALAPFAADRIVDQVDRFAGASPVQGANGRRARMRLALVTGDAIDNQQSNELDWLRTVLDGGRLDPNSGTSSGPPGCPQEGSSARYTGVQDYDDYADSPEFYDPDQPAGRFAAWPAYTGLMDRAQRPFDAVGLRVPWYLAYGNHDRLVQGNQAANASFEGVATGCLKALQTFVDLRTALTTLSPAFLVQALTTDPASVMQVPADPRRFFLTSRQYKSRLADGHRDGHGFGLVDPRENAASNGAAGYYAWRPAPGVRFVVMDMTADVGIAGPGAGGNVDDPQYRWIERQLKAARTRDELVVAFSHPTAGTSDSNQPDELAGSCGAPDAHGHPSNPGCDADPRASTPLHLGADMVELFKRYPNVVGWVNGHTHENRLTAFRGSRGLGFWEMETASVSDVPQQARLVELMDNRDGTLSIFGTVVDSSAPAAAPPPGPAGGFETEQLASLHRVFAFNDPQGALNGRAGTSPDRNVELLLRDPRRRAGGAACRDRTAPRTRILRRPIRLSRRGLRARGRSRDRDCSPLAGPAARFRGRVARVQVSLAKRSGRRCRFLTRRGRLSRRRSCRRRVWLRARTRYSARRRLTVWRFRKRGRLSRGRYVLRARGRDGRGNLERARRSRRVRLRIR